MATPNLRVAELDFDTIKANLIAYLQTKPGFTDANYAASGLSVLLDVLAYNTHYNAVLANMLVPEMFLDTAVKRQTATLHAKRLGYVPISAMAPVAFVTLEVFPPDNPTTLTLGKNASFNATIDGTTLNFVTLDARTIQATNNRYQFINIPIYEGSINTFRYEVVSTDDKFVVPSFNADISKLKVTVQTSATNTNTDVFSSYSSIADITSKTAAYFIKVNEAGYYEVYFGDGIISQAIAIGNIVTLEFFITNKTVGNNSFNFSFNDTVGGYSNLTVTTISPATGGADPESIDAIKVNAQNKVLSQDRAVTALDYEAIIPTLINTDSVSVWGGEQNVPPIYGKVFISVKPAGTTAALTTTTKQYIQSQLITQKNIVGIIPQIIDPDYAFLIVNSTVYYNPSITQYATETLSTLIGYSIITFATANLNKFKKNLRYSALTTAIDLTDRSIISNITTLQLYKTIIPATGISTQYTMLFNNPIVASNNLQQTLKSTVINIAGAAYDLYLDDLLGVIRLYYLSSGIKVVYNANIGTVDYTNGLITLNSISFLNTANITVTVTPQSNDIIAMRNSILYLNPSDINVNVITESVDITKHIFTASR